MRFALAVLLGLVGGAIGHGDHSHGGNVQKPVVDEKADWMTVHMAEEHHVSEFDALSFFTLHDFDANGVWEPAEILRTYGLMDESARDVPEARRDEVKREVMRLLDGDGDGRVTREEFRKFIAAGNTLPDFGLGPGIHADYEEAYERDHWIKFHEQTGKTELKDLVHPEDIEHFKKHEEIEREQERLDELDRLSIVLENIPKKYLRREP